MPCYHPLQGYREAELTKNGKRKIAFGAGGYRDLPVEVPCGQCIGCRLERARQWAVRLSHERQLHTHAHFVTLTYSDQNLPPGGSLEPGHMTLFLKRLRRKCGKLRYYYSGEYGSATERPHYHAIIFGLKIPDLVKCGGTADQPVFTSKIIEETWGLGRHEIGSVTFASCRYVAGYIVDKLDNKKAEAYDVVVPSTGEIVRRYPPFSRMSLKPAIGQGWFDQFASDVYPSDTVVLNGKEQKPPKFYDRKLETISPTTLQRVKRLRTRRAKRYASDASAERLQARKIVATAKLSLRKKSL